MNTCTFVQIGGGGALGDVGGKAASLARLVALGLPVPDGFVVRTSAYESHLRSSGLLAFLKESAPRGDWAAVEKLAAERLSCARLDPLLEDEIIRRWEELGAGAVAVRSSATSEDLGDASFAGQYVSLLNVSEPRALVAAVRSCWASTWSRRALQYRHGCGIAVDGVKMAVVVQRMVPADAAGVLFTVDPLSQRRDRMFVEVVRGLGETLVSGETRGETRLIDRTREDLRMEGSALSCVTREQVSEIARLGLRVEREAGCPQDIEFAVARGRVWILQARPITTLAEDLPATPALTFMDRAVQPLVRERYPIAPTPLDNAVYVRMVGAAAFTAGRFGVIINDVDVAEFRRTLWRQRYQLPRSRATLRILLAPRKCFAMLRTDWLAWWRGGPGPALQQLAAPVELDRLSDAELLGRFDRILTAWEEPLNLRFEAAACIDIEPTLRRLMALCFGPAEATRLWSQLLSGLDTPTGAMNSDLWELSRTVRTDPELLEAVRGGGWRELPASPAGVALRAAFQRFIARYGHRETGGFYLSTPTWRQDPTAVWLMLRALSHADTRPEEAKGTHAEALGRIARRLRWLPPLRDWLIARIGDLRRVHEFREVSHFDLTLPLDALQAITRCAAGRLHARGLLRSVDEVFFLTLEELRAVLLQGQLPDGSSISVRLSRRRATYRLVNARWQMSRQRRARSGGVLKGLGVSAGRARGRARVIVSEAQFDALQKGEILVCPFSNPSWTPLFALAAGVVSETGGPASHAAIVAREYGIPAVMSVAGATQSIHDGDELEIDGGTGRIIRCQPVRRGEPVPSADAPKPRNQPPRPQTSLSNHG